ncbi:MAG: hypothetical protein UY65_C0010G0009 [Parcubacteria group bacterium GW2011_GWA2_51_12]|nr:MAG: hypothetical protein UY65_C0010G0009 [Parcubacteria group bacterium GW2011_GWA2_51_12]
MSEWRDPRKSPHARALHYLHELLRSYGAMPIAKYLNRRGIRANQVTVVRVFYFVILAPLKVFELPYEGFLEIFSFALFAWTDLLDGALARVEQKLEQKHSDWGTILDPLADKVLIGTVYAIHLEHAFWLVTVTFFGEVLLMTTALIYKNFASAMDQDFLIEKLRANIWGKTKMTLEVATGFLILFYDVYPVQSLDNALNITGWSAVGFLGCSLFAKVKEIAR